MAFGVIKFYSLSPRGIPKGEAMRVCECRRNRANDFPKFRPSPGKGIPQIKQSLSPKLT